jgi:ribulose-phosphate 3-epimerase
MAEIIPAIMPRSFEDLVEKAGLFAGLAKIVQIDVMDGIFVPEKTWPYQGNSDPFYEIVAKERSLPQGGVVEYEVDLMVARPENCLKGWVETGMRRVIAHIESIGDLQYFLKNLRHNKYPQINSDRPQNFEFGFALNIDTPNETLYDLIADDRANARPVIDFVQFMGIANIGYQGQPFDGRVLPKIAELRARYNDIIISVDGGVNFDSAPKLLQAGANRLVAGSAILQSGNINEAVGKFKNLSL